MDRVINYDLIYEEDLINKSAVQFKLEIVVLSIYFEINPEGI